MGFIDTVHGCLGDLLLRPAIHVALCQRAKFEGWLKVEIANALQSHGASVRLECAIEGTGYRADVGVELPDEGRGLLMLKTINTNFRFPGVETRTRPITMNIEDLIKDLGKLRAGVAPCAKCLAFPVFPMNQSAEARYLQLAPYLGRIRQAGGRIQHESFGVPGCSNGSWGISWFTVEA